MKTGKEEEFKLKICWGAFKQSSDNFMEWVPNEKLKMSADEQYKQNKENGCFDRMHLVLNHSRHYDE